MNITDIFNRNSAALAPLAGVTDSVYRCICVELGARPVMTEMISAEGFIRCHPSDKSWRLFRFHEHERPIGFQLFGSNPERMAEAALRAAALGPDFIDINAGCPVRKVISHGAGSALLQNLPLLSKIVKSVAEAVCLPVTVKLRSGWDHSNQNGVEAAHVCADSGAQAVIMHPRTRSQGFSGVSDWNIIRRVKETVHIPVIGSGDIRKAEDALRMFDETGADSVMIGRGALGNPWIFSQVKELIEGKAVTPTPGIDVRLELALRQLSILAEEVSEIFSVLNMRKFFGWYSRGMRGGAEFRQKIYKAETEKEVRNIVEEYRLNGYESYGEDIPVEFPVDLAVN